MLERLAEVQRLVRELEKLDPSVCDRTAGLETAVVELQELERSLADYVEDLDLDPAEAAALEERIGMIESLKRKYGPSLAEVLERAGARRRAGSTRSRTAASGWRRWRPS